MLAFHPHHHHHHSNPPRLDSPPRGGGTHSFASAGLSRADGRMGYGAFKDNSNTTPLRPRTLSLAPSSSPLKSPPDLFPTFTDFLPRLNEVQQGSSYGSQSSKRGKERQSWQDHKPKTMGLGLIFGDDDEGDEGRLPLDGRQGVAELGLGRDPFLFHHSTTPNRSNTVDNSFTFCASDSFPSTDSRSRSHSDDKPTTTQATSRSLRSPSPRFKYFQPTLQPSPIAHHSLPITPPHTPQRSPSLPLRPPPLQQHLPPTPPIYSSLPLHPPPPPPPQQYPLTPRDTALIASLHNGRTPSLEQLAPPEHESGGGQQPIVNTGNQGRMVVQQGDWACGVCSFVNWRRRKICLRCFPYANDIGNVLTINSQRAASLALNHAPPNSAQAPHHHHQLTTQYPHPHQQQSQQQHIFPPPFSHIGSSPQTPIAHPLSCNTRPPLFHHTSAPTVPLTRYGGGTNLPAVIWNEAPRGGGAPRVEGRRGGGGEGGLYGAY